MHHSLTLQGDIASSNMLTLARLNELERKMEKMEIVCIIIIIIIIATLLLQYMTLAIIVFNNYY